MADSREPAGARKERRTSRSRSRSRSRSIASRSVRERSYDSDEERRRRRRRREKEEGGGRRERRNEEGGRRERRDEEGGGERREAKDDGRDAKRRRSRSPRAGGESERKHRREREHRSHRERDRDSKHRPRHSRSPRPRSRDRDARPAQADATAERQVTRKSAAPLPSQAAMFAGDAGGAGDVVLHDGQPPVEKQQPNFAPTGLLAAATKTVETATGSTVVLKYHEPSEARKPAARDAWKLFVFKGSEIVETVELGLRSCWLVGREAAVADLLAAHPSVSKQHAVVQFRYVERRNEFGDKTGRVKPYLMDLESANGTRLNGEKVESARYVELRDKDLVQFGDSTREYVVMLPPRD